MSQCKKEFLSSSGKVLSALGIVQSTSVRSNWTLMCDYCGLLCYIVSRGAGRRRAFSVLFVICETHTFTTPSLNPGAHLSGERERERERTQGGGHAQFVIASQPFRGGTTGGKMFFVCFCFLFTKI